MFQQVTVRAFPVKSLPQPWTSIVAPIDTSFYHRHPFIQFIDTKKQSADLVRLTDEDFLDKAGKIVFRVNRYDVLTNDSLLRLLETEVIPHINRDSLRLLRIVLRGAASPEGPYANNKMLGRRRAQTLADFLRKRLNVPVEEGAFTSEVVIEDYRLLCVMMRRACDPDLSLVETYCNHHLPRHEYTLLKRRLQKVRNGDLWRHLLRDYYPELRAARVVLFFEKPAEPEKPVKTEEPASPEVVEAAIPEMPVMPEFKETPEEQPDIYLPRREVLSVKTNLLYDVAYVPGYDRWCPIPNIAIEYYPLHGHFTFGASLDHPWWQHYWKHKFFQIRNWQVETRYYLRSGDISKNPEGEGAAFRGFYMQAYLQATRFGLCFDADRGWMGEGGGAGVGIGYVMQLSPKGHWRLEFGLQAGYFLCRYDPYQFENLVNPNFRDHNYYYRWTGRVRDFKHRQYRYSFFGPTRVGVTLSYDLLYRPRQSKKRGVSFRPQERRAKK